jgi:acyl transferase domain-containing protein
MTRVAFLFPGQGAQYAGMGRDLDHLPEFAAALDACASTWSLDIPLRDLLFTVGDDAAARLRETQYLQPALFCIEYALARAVIARGITPSLLIGHSIGEFVAAVLAGCCSLAEGLALVSERGRLMQALPPGAMLTIRAPAAEILPRLRGDVGLAAENSPTTCVAAGPKEAIAELRAELAKARIAAKELHTSHAFHSPMMAPAVAPLRTRAAQILWRAPRILIVSTVTGQPLAEFSADYFAEQLRAPVRFARAVATAWTDPTLVLLEVGPRNTLSTLARAQAEGARRTLATLGDTPENERASLDAALGQVPRSL